MSPRIPYPALAAFAALAVMLPLMAVQPALLGSALLLLLAGVLLSGGRDAITLRASDGLVFALVTWLAAGTLLRAVPWVSVYTFWEVGAFALAYLLVRSADTSNRELLLLGIVVGGACIAATSIARHLLHDDYLVLFSVRNNQAAFMGAIALLAGGCAIVAHTRRFPWTLLATLMATALWLTGSRAGGLAYVGAAFLFAGALVFARQRRLALFAVILPAAIGYAVAALLTAGQTLQRTASLADPLSVGANRIAIWESAWPLVRDAPLFGTGLATTYAQWAARRPPGETSAGSFLHNDYLQFALEGGWIAALLWLAIAAAAAWTVVIAARRLRAGEDGHATITGLAASCAAALVFAHSAVDINLQLPVMLALIGMMLALGPGTLLAGRVVWVPDGARRALLAVLVVAVGLKGTLYVAFGVVVPDEFARGDAVAIERQLTRLRWAIHIEPRAGIERMNYADLIRQAARQVEDPALRFQMYQEARTHADRAVALNPMSHWAHFRRALLLDEFREFVPEPDAVANALARTLEIEPRLYIARAPLMHHLMSTGKHREAWALGLAGLDFRYINSVEYLEYLDATIDAGLAVDAGAPLDRVYLRRAEVAAALDELRGIVR